MTVSTSPFPFFAAFFSSFFACFTTAFPFFSFGFSGSIGDSSTSSATLFGMPPALYLSGESSPIILWILFRRASSTCSPFAASFFSIFGSSSSPSPANMGLMSNPPGAADSLRSAPSPIGFMRLPFAGISSFETCFFSSASSFSTSGSEASSDSSSCAWVSARSKVAFGLADGDSSSSNASSGLSSRSSSSGLASSSGAGGASSGPSFFSLALRLSTRSRAERIISSSFCSGSLGPWI